MGKYVEGAMFQVGQKVRVIDHLTKYKHLFDLTQEMIDKYGGKEVTISYVGNYNKHGQMHVSNYPKPCDNFIYHIKEDRDMFYWSNTMFMVV